MDLNEFKTPLAEETGQWFEEGDAKFLVRSIRCKPYQDALANAIEEHRDEFRKASRRNAKAEARAKARALRTEITRRLIATVCLVNWTGVTDGGKEVPFSTAAADDLTKRYPKFGDLLAEFAMDEFEDEEAADQEGIENAKNG